MSSRPLDVASRSRGAFYMNRNRGAVRYDPRHEFLHGDAREQLTDAALTETQYFGFNIPEERIHGLVYVWWHPNLGVVSGGVWAFQGFKPHVLASELFDWHHFMSDAGLVEGDLRNYRLDNGLASRILEPGRRYSVQYEDPARDNLLDLELTAVIPPFVFEDERHLEQTMRTRGRLVLRGRSYELDGYSVRDRSWGSLRSEAHEALPPMTWMSGGFDGDFSFCASALDHPARNPEWAGEFDIPGERTLVGGYVHDGGETHAVVACRKRTTHDPRTLYPTKIEMDLEDAAGRRYSMTGTVIAACGMSLWLNITIPVCLTRWECNGRIGYGDSQDVQWADFVYRRLNDASVA